MFAQICFPYVTGMCFERRLFSASLCIWLDAWLIGRIKLRITAHFFFHCANKGTRWRFTVIAVMNDFISFSLNRIRNISGVFRLSRLKKKNGSWSIWSDNFWYWLKKIFIYSSHSIRYRFLPLCVRLFIQSFSLCYTYVDPLNVRIQLGHDQHGTISPLNRISEISDFQNPSSSSQIFWKMFFFILFFINLLDKKFSQPMVQRYVAGTTNLNGDGSSCGYG